MLSHGDGAPLLPSCGAARARLVMPGAWDGPSRVKIIAETQHCHTDAQHLKDAANIIVGASSARSVAHVGASRARGMQRATCFGGVARDPLRGQVAASTQPRQGYGYAGEAPLLPKEELAARRRFTMRAIEVS